MANPVNKKKSPLLVILFTIIGLGFLAAGIGLTITAYDFSENATSTTGAVVSVEVNYGENSTTYRPTIRFLDFAGRKQRSTTFLSSSNYNYDVGQKIDIIYDVRDPSKMRIDSWFAIWGLGFIFLVVGAVLSVVMISVSIKRRSSSRASSVSSTRDRFSKTMEDHTPETSRKYVSHASRETAEDHAREENYTPTVRRS